MFLMKEPLHPYRLNINITKYFFFNYLRQYNVALIILSISLRLYSINIKEFTLFFALKRNQEILLVHPWGEMQVT